MGRKKNRELDNIFGTEGVPYKERQVHNVVVGFLLTFTNSVKVGL